MAPGPRTWCILLALVAALPFGVGAQPYDNTTGTNTTGEGNATADSNATANATVGAACAPSAPSAGVGHRLEPGLDCQAAGRNVAFTYNETLVGVEDLTFLAANTVVFTNISLGNASFNGVARAQASGVQFRLESGEARLHIIDLPTAILTIDASPLSPATLAVSPVVQVVAPLPGLDNATTGNGTGNGTNATSGNATGNTTGNTTVGNGTSGANATGLQTFQLSIMDAWTGHLTGSGLSFNATRSTFTVTENAHFRTLASNATGVAEANATRIDEAVVRGEVLAEILVGEPGEHPAVASNGDLVVLDLDGDNATGVLLLSQVTCVCTGPTVLVFTFDPDRWSADTGAGGGEDLVVRIDGANASEAGDADDALSADDDATDEFLVVGTEDAVRVVVSAREFMGASQIEIAQEVAVRPPPVAPPPIFDDDGNVSDDDEFADEENETGIDVPGAAPLLVALAFAAAGLALRACRPKR